MGSRKSTTCISTTTGTPLSEYESQQQAEAAKKAGVSLVTDLPSSAVRIEGDAALLSRVFANLLGNAIRHTPAGGEVRIKIRTRGEHAYAKVSDTGEGIPETARKRIFERFFRVDEARARNSGGCGLGLAICKSLMEAHGGAILYRHRDEGGTTFELRLPLAESRLADSDA